jgi:gliding motility-associated-like protein
VFTGITMNGDGLNDVLFIENISEFPNNRLTVYNRWGTQLYDQQKYDNLTNAWPTADDANKLVSSTYFYVLDLGDGSKPLKGWIELIKN